MMHLRTVLLPLLAIPYVSAHGFVHKVWIGTKTYLGNTPSAEPTASIVRQINSVDPVKGANNPFVNCGNDAQFASDIADANPGDSMSFLWTREDLSRWPHSIGPMLTYMTSCGSTGCTTFNSSNAKWFKIAQVGRIPGDPDGTWFQNNLFENDGVPANVTLPKNIAPGAYLIRHEIIALHLASRLGGAQFYPSCSQIRVGGNGNGTPHDDELVTLPGAYSDTDPGILVTDVFDTPPPPYIFPGPPIATFFSDSSSGSGSGSSSPSTSTSATAHASSSSPPPSSSARTRAFIRRQHTLINSPTHLLMLTTLMTGFLYQLHPWTH